MKTLTRMTGEELQEARLRSIERCLAVAEALRYEAGIVRHTVRKALSGYARPDGTIEAPEGRTRKQLYILAHECAHVKLHHFGGRIPRHRQEMEAEKWAHVALRRHGIPVPRSMTKRAKVYVGRKIKQAIRRGAKRIDAEAARYARRSSSRAVIK